MNVTYYNKNNIKLLYLSPYISIKDNKDEVVFYNYIYNTITILKYKENMKKFLSKGNSEDDILKYLETLKYSKEETQIIFERLLKNGVLE